MFLSYFIYLLMDRDRKILGENRERKAGKWLYITHVRIYWWQKYISSFLPYHLNFHSNILLIFGLSVIILDFLFPWKAYFNIMRSFYCSYFNESNVLGKWFSSYSIIRARVVIHYFDIWIQPMKNSVKQISSEGKIQSILSCVVDFTRLEHSWFLDLIHLLRLSKTL